MLRRVGGILFAVLVTVISATPGNQAQEKQQSPKASQIPLKTPRGGPSQHILFTGKIREASLGEFKKFFRTELMPLILNSSNILRVDTYTNVIGGDYKFVVLLEVRGGVPLSHDTAVAILSNGRSPQEALKMLDRFASFFEATSTSVILYRPDLSLSRVGTGFALAGKQ